ncbi:MAG: tyrosine-type recombinase/integrase [bacterium]
MSIYFRKGRGWKFDFTLRNRRYTSTYYKTKSEAKKAEAKRREEIESPKQITQAQTDMDFLELVNRRLDYAEAYNSESHYETFFYFGRKWVKRWKDQRCSDITPDMVQSYVFKRAKVSAFTANKEIRYLRGLFNFGIRKGWITKNPAKTIAFLPIEKKLKYIPPIEDIQKVICAADPGTQDYLWTIIYTMGRMNEINRLMWEDVNFNEKYVVLYTRKKKGGNRTPRKIPMTDMLCDILMGRYECRDRSKPWIFWHRYWSRKNKTFIEGPYKSRKCIMKSLCKKTGVRYFRFHALRHFGASLLDNANVPIGAIQRILGHENRTTTEIYLHSIGQAERHALAVLERECQKSHTQSLTQSLTQIKKQDLPETANSLILYGVDGGI